MKKIQTIKSEKQSLAVQISKKNRHLCLEWSTGVGKSLAAIRIIEEILSTRRNSHGVIICKESTHLKNWEDEFVKHGKKTVMKRVSMFLYASLHKHQNHSTHPDFIVLDECHALTEKRVALLKPLIGPSTKVILLSATIPEDKKDLIKGLLGSVYNYKITLLQAIKEGLLPEPKLIVHKMKLEPKGSHDYVFKKAIKGKKTVKCKPGEEWSVYNNNPKGTGITVVCNEIQYYNLITKQMAYYKDLMIKSGRKYGPAIRNKFLNLGSQRKKFISKVKTDKTANIVKQLRGSQKRFICFAGTIDQSVKLGAKSSVNSRNKHEVNQDIISCFNDKSCSELFAVKMLRESVNLTDIEKGVIVQLDSTVGSFFQMFGRCLRHEFPEMHLIVIQDTQDEVYFENAMSDFDNKYVTYEIN